VRVYLGLDLGQRADHSALAVLYLHQYFTGRIDPATRVREVACEAAGDPECRFELKW
jgi:hypothetical protein